MTFPRHLRRGARRVGSTLAFCAAVLLLLVVPAAAKKINGGPAPETLSGTGKADQIYGRGGGDSLFGRAGDDLLVGGAGNDSINGGRGRDTILGGPGSDRILAADGYADKIDCGPGWDVAIVDALDTVAANCEVVKRGGTLTTSSVVPSPSPASPTQSPRLDTAPAPSPAPEGPAEPGKEQGSEGEPEGSEGEEGEHGEGEGEDGEGEGGEGEGGEGEGGGQEQIPVYEEHPLAMFPAGHGWTNNGVGTFEDAGPPFVVNNDRSYKIQTDGSGDASIATSPELTPVDLTAAHVAVQGLVSFSGRLGQVRLRLSSGDIETDYAEATVWEEGRDPTVLGTTFEYQSIPTGGFTVHGEVDWSKIDRAQLIVTDNGTGSVIFYAAGIYAVPTYRTPTVSFAFDDGPESTFTLGVKKLTQFRMPATAYVIADAIGRPGFITEEQLYTMRNLDKWEIGGHAATLEDHNEPNGLDSLSPERLKADFDEMREWMFEHGFAQRTFAYPKGAAGQEVRKYAERDYCAARVTAAGPETIPPRNPFVIRGFSIDSAETHLAELEREVDRAIAEKSWLVLTFHNLVTGAPAETTDFNYGEFAQLVDYVHARQAQGKLQVRTVADAVGC